MSFVAPSILFHSVLVSIVSITNLNVVMSPPRHLQYIFLKRFYIMSTFTNVSLTDKLIATSRPVVHAQQLEPLQ